MGEHDHNTPAFPLNEKHDHGGHFYSHCGMTLRDYFAAHVIEQCIRNAMCDDGSWDPTNVAYHAYLVADALLAERSKRES